jgi:uncharacterized protein (TIGR03083 family)
MDSLLPPAGSSVATYAGIRSRVCDLLAQLPDTEAAAVPVPACPGWTVTDAVAHLYGVVSDILEGNLDGVGTAPWADDQVRRFAPWGLRQLLERWNEASPAVEAMGGGFPARSTAQFVFDACTHEHDIRGALGRPGGRGSDSVHVGLAFIAGALDGLVTEGRLPGVELDSPDFHAVLGEPPVPVRLSAPTFELFRSFGGRRSPAQFRSLAWEGDPAPFLAFFAGGPIRPPDEDLVE